MIDIQTLAIVVCGIILIYLIQRRLKVKDTEEFEKRDN